MSEVIAQAKGNLFVFPHEDDTPRNHGEVNIEIAHIEKFDYTFSLIKNGRTLFCQVIEDTMSISYQGNSLEWLVQRSDGNPPSRMRIEFIKDEAENYKVVILAIARALIESSMEMPIDSCYKEEEDRDWAISAQLPDMRDDEESEFFDFVDEEPQKARMSDASSESEEEGVSQPLFKETKRTSPADEQVQSFTHKGKNTLMVSGLKLNRTFVSSGNQLGVFGHNSNDEIEYVSKLNAIRRPDGTVITNPVKMQLHNADTQLLFLDSDNKKNVYNMDLETGRIVEEWKADDVDIINLAPRQKYAQVSNEQLVVGVNSSGVFSIDPRLNTQNKIAESMFYSTKVDLTSAATTGTGLTATASGTGDIRLCSKIQKNYCKTLLPGIGAPVSHIEVTEDGEWLLATSKKCLILFNLRIIGGKDAGGLGFEKRMGQFKPTPLVLKISAADMMKYNIQSTDFTPARFNTGTVANSTEEYIITSTGDLIITWDFKKVKKGILSAYKIRRASSNVVEDMFRHNFKEQLLVAQTNEVYASRLDPHKRR